MKKSLFLVFFCFFLVVLLLENGVDCSHTASLKETLNESLIEVRELMSDENRENVIQEFEKLSEAICQGVPNIEMEPFVLALALGLDEIIDFYLLERNYQVKYHHLLYFDHFHPEDSFFNHKKWLNNDFSNNCEKVDWVIEQTHKQMFKLEELCLQEKYSWRYGECRSEERMQENTNKAREREKKVYPTSYNIYLLYDFLDIYDPVFENTEKMVNSMLLNSDEISGITFDIYARILSKVTSESHEYVKSNFFSDIEGNIFDFNLLLQTIENHDISSSVNLFNIVPNLLEKDSVDVPLLKDISLYKKLTFVNDIVAQNIDVDNENTMCTLQREIQSTLQLSLITLYYGTDLSGYEILGYPDPIVCQKDTMMMELLELIIEKLVNLYDEEEYLSCGEEVSSELWESMYHHMMVIAKHNESNFLPVIDYMIFVAEEILGIPVDFSSMEVEGVLYDESRGNSLIHEAVGSKFPALVYRIVKRQPELCGQENKSGWTPIKIAMVNQDEEMMKMLLAFMEEEEREKSLEFIRKIISNSGFDVDEEDEL